VPPAAAFERDHPQKPSIQVVRKEGQAMRTILESYKLVRNLNLLHSIPFVTVFDYLFLLRGIAQIMNGSSAAGERVGPQGLYYLAAAVSDFFLPQQKMVRIG
jgi:phosphopantothenate-cysteine ligase